MKIFAITILSITFIFLSKTTSHASDCTYKSTLNGNHLDFAITNNLDKLAVVQYIRLNGSSLVTKMYAPNIGDAWTYFDDFSCNVGLSTPIGCRQNRQGSLGDGAFWQWYNWSTNNYHLLPGGEWALDFNIPPTPDSFDIIYKDIFNGNWISCKRTGDITLSKPQLTIVKTLVNDNGGDAIVGDFSISIDGTNVSSPTFNASASAAIVTLDPGQYTVNETGPSGYKKTAGEECSGYIAAGEAKTCTIIDDDITPTVTLIKNVTNNIGEIDPDDFEININGNIVISGLKNDVLANVPININEKGIANYNFVSITGDGCPSGLGDSVTLSLAQNLICTITNNYVPPPDPTPIPIPVTKVVIIPGLGATWNLDAFATCKKTGYAGSWNIAPYAENIYMHLTEMLSTKGFTPVPFYYDWRQEINNNTPLLKTFINFQTSSNEKVNIVGHSMGGLIAEKYLLDQGEAKVSKFMAVGAPNKGSSLVYPTIIGKEIWTDDLVGKIAATLFVSHCDIPDSFWNLLPIYNYIRWYPSKNLVNVDLMKTKNNLLPIDLPSNFQEIKIGNLIGSGYKTLNIIDVVKNFQWPDGKPVNKEYSNDGDGTVLTQSAQIPGVIPEIINKSHSGIIASDEGVSHILTFFGTPTTDDPDYSEPKSALVLIGYPNSFSLTNEKNNKTDSKDGMVVIMDPKDGKYQVQIAPGSTNTTFIVSQFLQNGQTEYKEYKFNGKNQSTKIIEFDSKHPKADILREVEKYNKPHPIPFFPKFWFNFRNFWNWFRR